MERRGGFGWSIAIGLLLMQISAITTHLEAQQSDTLLARAAREGEVEEVRRLLDAGVDPDAGLGGWTPLMFAAMNGETEIAAILIDAGASLSRTNDDFGTALGTAAVALVTPSEGKTAMVDLLLDAGAETESGNGVMMTPLMYAAREGKREIVARLLAAGANASHQDVRGWSPLLFAVRSGDPEIVRMMIEGGAWVDAPTELPSSRPIHFLTGKLRVEIARMLLDAGADPDGVEYGPERATPVLTAAARGDRELVELLLDEGAWPNQAIYLFVEGVEEEVQGHPMTAIDWGEHVGDEKMVEMLREAGGLRYEELVEVYGGIRDAIAARDLDRLDELLEQPIDPADYLLIGEEEHFSPVSLAFDSGDLEVLKHLLPRVELGYYDLLWRLEDALAEEKDDLVTLLVEEYPLYALAIILESGHTDELLEMALERIEEDDLCTRSAGPYGSILQAAAASGERGLIVELQRRGCDIDAPDRAGRTPLFGAVGSENIETMRYLLEKGADPEARSDVGDSPLLEGVRTGNVEVLALLLEFGADIEGRGGFGSTPLHLAAWMGKESLVTYLLSKGADPNARTHFGETPVDQAIRSRHPEVARLIRAAGGREG